jgi:hypothetical protein
MKTLTKEKQKEILNKTFITIDDVYNVLPIGKNYSAKIFKDIEAEMKRKEIPCFITRPRVIPTDMLIARFPQLEKLRKE